MRLRVPLNGTSGLSLYEGVSFQPPSGFTPGVNGLCVGKLGSRETTTRSRKIFHLDASACFLYNTSKLSTEKIGCRRSWGEGFVDLISYMVNWANISIDWLGQLIWPAKDHIVAKHSISTTNHLAGPSSWFLQVISGLKQLIVFEKRSVTWDNQLISPRDQLTTGQFFQLVLPKDELTAK